MLPAGEDLADPVAPSVSQSRDRDVHLHPVRTLPEAPVEADVDLMDARTLLVLTLGSGLVAVGLTAIGQGHGGPSVALAAVGALVLALVLRPGRRPPVLGPPGRDAGYAVATLSAATAMAVMGITVVSVPVYLGTRLDLGPGLIGVATLALALGMTTFAPLAGRISARVGTRTTLAGGLVAITLVAPTLGIIEARGEDTSVLPVLLGVLFGVGCGIATVQSMAALVLLDVPGRSGTSMGGAQHGPLHRAVPRVRVAGALAPPRPATPHPPRQRGGRPRPARRARPRDPREGPGQASGCSVGKTRPDISMTRCRAGLRSSDRQARLAYV